ncbi:hypothetical protein ACMFMG_009244 [Clarireedia jacksonii]
MAFPRTPSHITVFPGAINYHFEIADVDLEDTAPGSELEKVDLENVQWHPSVIDKNMRVGDAIPVIWQAIHSPQLDPVGLNATSIKDTRRSNTIASDTYQVEISQATSALSSGAAKCKANLINPSRVDTSSGTWQAVNKPPYSPPIHFPLSHHQPSNPFKPCTCQRQINTASICSAYHISKLKYVRQCYEHEHSYEFVKEQLDWFELRAQRINSSCKDFNWEVAAFCADRDAFAKRQKWIALELRRIDGTFRRMRRCRELRQKKIADGKEKHLLKDEWV